jgi:hypothetical protein
VDLKTPVGLSSEIGAVCWKVLTLLLGRLAELDWAVGRKLSSPTDECLVETSGIGMSPSRNNRLGRLSRRLEPASWRFISDTFTNVLQLHPCGKRLGCSVVLALVVSCRISYITLAFDVTDKILAVCKA